MAKQVVKKIKVQAMGGAATPAPPLGPALGQANSSVAIPPRLSISGR